MADNQMKEGYATAGFMALAFLSGAAAGAATALLTAPQAGRRTREQLVAAIDPRNDDDGARRLPPDVRHAYNEAALAGRRAFTEAYHQEMGELVEE